MHMDSIMQYTDGLLTAGATLWFAATFLLGIWFAAKFGKTALLPSIILGVAVSYVRFGFPAEPLTLLAIGSMGGLHLAAGVWLGLLFNRGKGSKSA
jgi:hypothetical protein